MGRSGLRAALGLLLVLLTGLSVPAAAPAARDLEVGIADDAVFLHRPAQAPRIVRRWKALGVEVARVHARWIVIAPRPHDRRPPRGFNATAHTDPGYNWATLDLAVDTLRAAGIRPMVSITGSGPLWTSLEPRRGNHRWKPDPAQFAAFAHAVATRYRGRVHRYIVWNEPNQAAWLQPQFTCRSGRCAPFSPHHYRRLYRAAYDAVKRVDPGAQVLTGALAPKGSNPRRPNAAMRPLTFLRAMSCVSERYRRLRSGGCPRQGALRTDGLAYHPHGVQRAPDQRNPQRDEAGLADLPRLKAALDRSVARGILRGPSRRRPLDLYLTEYAYQTNPPDRAIGVSLAKQARWLAQSSYLAWRDPRVRTLAHYEWRDEKISRKAPTGTRAYASWQSGLLFADGRRKPALAVFPNPLWAFTSGARVRLWGQVRPGEGRTGVVVLRRRAGSRTARPVARVRTDRRGVWTTSLSRRGARRGDTYAFRYVLPPAVTGRATPLRRTTPALRPAGVRPRTR